MSLEFSRVTRAHPCPICQKDTWCEVGDRAVLCMRVESDHPNDKPAGGWYHHTTDNTYQHIRKLPKKAPAPPINAAEILRGWMNGTTGGDLADKISYLSKHLGVSQYALLHLDATWSKFDLAWGFPMRDGIGETIGIRLRNYDGKKWAVRGSRSGLFYDVALSWTGKYDVALITEGPTDTAAALTLGFFAIGKPCCNACNPFVVDVLKRIKCKRAVIVSDVDSMAQNGIGFNEAKKLQKMLPCKSAVWAPQAKDIRAFLNAGGTRAMIENDLKSLLWQ